MIIGLNAFGPKHGWALRQTGIKVAFSFFLSGPKLTMCIFIKTFTAPFSICPFSKYINFPFHFRRHFGRRNLARARFSLFFDISNKQVLFSFTKRLLEELFTALSYSHFQEWLRVSCHTDRCQKVFRPALR